MGVVTARTLHPLEYPVAIRELTPLPYALSVEGDLTPAAWHVAIVGARAATPTTIRLVKRIAKVVVAAGGVVISGGANGADTAAHEGAIEAGGRTWSVLGCGAPHITPNVPDRFARILTSGGAIVRPFPDGTKPISSCFPKRNRILVALADIVVIAQAAVGSGTTNAAEHARDLRREIWVVPGVGDAFVGSWEIVERGARVMRHESELAERLAPRPKLEGDAHAVYETLSHNPKHPDQIALETGLSTSAVATALLTLALGDVVVEGSAGLFRRKNLL